MSVGVRVTGTCAYFLHDCLDRHLQGLRLRAGDLQRYHNHEYKLEQAIENWELHNKLEQLRRAAAARANSAGQRACTQAARSERLGKRRKGPARARRVTPRALNKQTPPL